MLLAAWRKSGYWPIDRNRSAVPQTTPPQIGMGVGLGAGMGASVGTGVDADAGATYRIADTSGRLKHFAADIEARAKMVDPAGALIAIV